MSQDVYNFTFSDEISPLQARATFMLALVAVQSLHGAVAVSMECRFHSNLMRKQYHVHSGSPIGNDLARIFAGFCFNAYGPEAVKVRRGYAPKSPWPETAKPRFSLFGGHVQ